MREAMREYGGAAAVLAAAAGLLGVMAGCGGFALEDLIRVGGVPHAVREATGLGPNPTLREAEAAIPMWQMHVKVNTEAYADVLDNAAFWRGVIGATLNDGLAAATESGAIAALPGGAVATGLLTFAGGLLLPKPGTKKATDGLRAQAAEAEKRAQEAEAAAREARAEARAEREARREQIEAGVRQAVAAGVGRLGDGKIGEGSKA